MKIIGTGLSGLVGSRVVELMSQDHTFTNLSLETGIDITKPGVANTHITQSDAEWVFHFAAMTDVDGAEKERSLGEASMSWLVNVKATQYVADAARSSGKRILYISTDFVFDGTREEYSETDVPNPIGWYAVTKYEGEKIIAKIPKSLIIRIANPYGREPGIRPDFVHKIMNRLESKQAIVAPQDQRFVPTFIDDIGSAIGVLATMNAEGLYHVVGTGNLSPYDVACKIATALNLDITLVSPTTFDEFFKNRAPRPYKAVLKNDKIQKLGVHMSTFDEGIDKIRLLREKKTI